MADYLGNSVHVEYYANGGTRTNGQDWIDGREGLCFRCTHHHVPNEKVVLMDPGQSTAYVERDGATLVGWSENPVKDLVKSNKEETSASIITEVTMPGSGKDNAKVYAVWAEDVNNNGKADYKETKIKLTFDIHGGDGSADKNHPTTYTVELLPGMYYDLPDYAHLHWFEKWEKDGAPANHPAVLAGWTKDATVKGIILEDDINDAAETHNHLSDSIIKQPHITVPNTNTTYYALYAADENGDDEPDYLEHAEQVEYYANGGTMISGTWLDGIDGLFYRCGHHHVVGEEVTLLLVDRGKELIKRDGAVLLGWSENQVELVTSEQAEIDAGITEKYTMPDSDGKVYAVWAVDANGNQIADYRETSTPSPSPSTSPSASPSPSSTPSPSAPGTSTAPSPSAPAAPTAAPGSSTSPQTGDENHPLLWMILCAASILGLAGVGYALYRRRKNQK